MLIKDTLTSRPFVVGLTGGIACGKSSIASIFAGLKVPVVDADDIARRVVEKGSPVLLRLKEHFGEKIINADGTLNRKRLREIAFDKDRPENLEALNSIMQKDIQNRIKTEIEKIDAPYVIAMVPLLFEQHLEHLVDRVLVVDVAPDLQLQRVMLRDNIDEKLATAMIQKQLSRELRIKKADDLIESDDSPLDKKVNVVLKLHNKYLNLAKLAKRDL